MGEPAEKIEQIESYKDQVESRVEQEQGKSGGDDGSGGNIIDSKFITDCFYANEVGDGTLYAAIHRGAFVHNNDTKDEWLMFGEHSWELDKTGRRLAAVEEVVETYKEEAYKVNARLRKIDNKKSDEAMSLEKLRDGLNGRAGKLRNINRRDNCLKAARTCAEPLTISYDDLDQNPMLLAAPNGVMDLETGKLRDGRPEDYITKACNVPFPENGIDTPTPHFLKYLEDSLEDDDIINYLHRLLGYSITGLSDLRIFPVFHGLRGQNGKGTLFDILYHILGPYAGPCQSEMLIANRNQRSSSGPTPDIMDLKGKRLVWASETEEGQRFASAKVKWLTGGDPLVGRNPNDRRQTTFIPTHSLFLLTNTKPGAPAHDNAFWIRARLIEFPFSFVEEPKEDWERQADPRLKHKLQEEASGILAWLVRGCLLWQEEGLQTPAKVKEATAEYRRDEDIIADFVRDCCLVDKDAEVNATEIYNVFKKWMKLNYPGRKQLSQRKFGDLMKLKFKKQTSGTVTYLGLKVRDNLDFSDD